MQGGMVQIARDLLPVILAAREETESGRQLAPRVADALRETRLCRLAVAAELAGHEAPPVETLQVYEVLAGCEASVAWIVWNHALPGYFGRFLSPDARAEIFDDPSWLYASSTRPSGRAAVEGDHYRVSGRWALVSGCELAEWLSLRCGIVENGAPRMLAPDVPEVRMMYVRRRDVRILDTWHSGGLRGTGSHDVVLEDARVPVRHTLSPFEPSTLSGAFGRLPIVCTMAAGYAAQLLGVAQASLDAVLKLCTVKPVVDPGPAMGDRPAVLASIAKHREQLAAARCHLHLAVARLWAACAATRPAADEIAAVYGAAHHAMGEGRDTIDAMYALGGASALYTSSPLERAHRDAHAMAAHIIAQGFWLEDTGRVMLGREPIYPLYLV